MEKSIWGIKKDVSREKLLLCMINERSKLFPFLEDIADCGANAMIPVQAEKERVYVKILFPDDYEAYERGLLIFFSIGMGDGNAEFRLHLLPVFKSSARGFYDRICYKLQ